MFADVAVVAPHVKSGKLRALAVSGSSRTPSFPSLPTVAEAALPGYSAGTWYGLFAPAGTPAPVLQRLSADVRAALAAPEVSNALVAQGVEPASSSPSEFGQFVRAEHAKWGKVIRDANVKVE
jgi:tripartite-type tricarboxylate transporter receptor subunit TctC